MTVEELLKCSAEKLESLSDSELKEIFSKYLLYTRRPLDDKTIRAAESLLDKSFEQKSAKLMLKVERILGK